MSRRCQPVTPFYDLSWRRPFWLFKTILRPFGRKLVPGLPAGGGDWDGPGPAGVREPRRPLPAAVAGAVELPLPLDLAS